jgi:hypothetical protein
MIDESMVLRLERLRDSVAELRGRIRDCYRGPRRLVTDAGIRALAALVGEKWLVELGASPQLTAIVGEGAAASLSVEFQHLLSYSEQSRQRKLYDAAINFILANFRTRIVVPLKTSRLQAPTDLTAASFRAAVAKRVPSIVFVGQSFAGRDRELNATVARFFVASGYEVLTGELPEASSVAAKVRRRIEQADIFAGVFTRREKLEGKDEWSTSPWIIDEKAYAMGHNKQLILLVEAGVGSIGGIHGDHEHLRFERDQLPDLLLGLVAICRSLG